MNSRHKAFFFDRDGVINYDDGYTSRIEDFIFVDGIFDVMRTLAAKGYLLIIITNQSGIGRNYYTEEDFQKLNAWMLRRFEAEQVKISGVYYCPHSPEADCVCRKPAPGMLLQAIREHTVAPECSWMIGDKESDMCAAEAAGIPNRVLIGAAESVHNTHKISNIKELLNLPV